MPHSSNACHKTTPLITSVLGAGFVAGLIPAGLLPANVLNIEHAYNLTHADMGRIVGLSMIFGGGIGGVLGGWLSGRIGAVRVLILSLVMAGAALATIGVGASLHATVAGLVGYFLASGFMGSANTLATLMLPDRERGITLLHALNAVGKLSGPILASLFLYAAWRNSFLAAAVLPLILIIPAILAYGRDGNGRIGRKKPGEGKVSIAFLAAVSGFAFIAGSEIAVALWIPAFAQEVRGYSAAQGNILLSLFLVGLISGRFVSSALSQTISSRRAIAVCAFALFFVIPSLSATSYLGTAVFLLLFGVAFSATWPSYFAHLSRRFPSHLGLMGGMAVFSSQVGFAVCSFVSGRLADISLVYPLIFGAATMGLFAVAFFASPIGKEAKGDITT